MRLLRVIIFLLLAGIAGLVGYAYFGDMDADPREMRVPVKLDPGIANSPAPLPQETVPAPASADAGSETQAPADALD